MTAQSTLFVSHGSPTLVIDDVPARAFLRQLGQQIDLPRAVLVVSAHWETRRPAVDVSSRPVTIHDFAGFAPTLYAIRYAASGAPELASRTAALIEAAGLGPVDCVERGLDHGAWVPLSLMFPDAQVPVAQLSIQPDRDARYHLELGRAIAVLRQQGVLVLATGSLTHNLGAVAWDCPSGPAWPWASEFAEAFARHAVAADESKLCDWQRTLPHAPRNHPTAEHLLPVFVAMGAAGPNPPVRRLHSSFTYRALAMDDYEFGASRSD